MRLSSGASTDGGGFGTLLGLGSEPNGWSKCAIGHTRTGPYDQGDIVFLTRATGDTSDCTMSDVKMRITSAGNVACTGSISCNSISLSNACIVAGNVGIKNASPYLYGTTYGFGINPNTLRYNSENFHRFYTGATNTMTLDSGGNLSTTGTITSSGKVFVNSGILVIDAADWGPNASKGSAFRSGYDVPNNNICKIDVAALPINIRLLDHVVTNVILPESTNV